MIKSITTTLLTASAAALLATASIASTTHPLPPLPLKAHTLAPSSATKFTFVAGGDNRATEAGEPMPPSINEIMLEIGYIKPDLTIWTGDTIQGYDDATMADVDAEYGVFKQMADQAQSPIFCIPGNHEIGFKPEMLDEYKKQMGPDYGSFDYAGSHFIGLDSTPVESDGKIHEGDIDPDQLAWLKQDLAANQDATNIFVFFHHYMYGPPDPDVPGSLDTGLEDTTERDMLHNLFKQYHVRAVFNGHSHMFYHKVVDGIDYYIAGNAGAPLDAAPEDGGFLGYSLITVNGTKLTVQNLTPWTLVTRTVDGNDGKSKTADIVFDAYEFGDITLRGISVLMPKAASYTAAALTKYKGKSPAADVTVASVEPVNAKENRVFLKLKAKAHRATYITVTAQ